MTLGQAYGAPGEGGASGSLEFAEVKLSSGGDDITLTTSNATYPWTSKTQESLVNLITLESNDEITINIGGTYDAHWSLLFASSGSPTVPFWVVSFLEIDVGGVGSWAYVVGSLTGNALSDDPGGGQTKISLAGSLIVELAAADKIRLRVRRGSGAAATVKTDGGNGSSLVFTRLSN